MQHLNTQNVIRGELQFFGHTFLEGQEFWAVNVRGAKILGPSPLK